MNGTVLQKTGLYVGTSSTWSDKMTMEVVKSDFGTTRLGTSNSALDSPKKQPSNDTLGWFGIFPSSNKMISSKIKPKCFTSIKTWHFLLVPSAARSSSRSSPRTWTLPATPLRCCCRGSEASRPTWGCLMGSRPRRKTAGVVTGGVVAVVVVAVAVAVVGWTWKSTSNSMAWMKRQDVFDLLWLLEKLEVLEMWWNCWNFWVCRPKDLEFHTAPMCDFWPNGM